jgi:glucose dehydrogenase
LLAAAQVTPEAIVQSPNAEWLTYHGDYSARRHSSLKQITTENVKSLVPKWVFHVEGAKKLEATPIVHDGLMYISNTNELYALECAQRAQGLALSGVGSARNSRQSRVGDPRR